jgi:hypothetical protein
MKSSSTSRLRDKANTLLREATATAWIVTPPNPDEISRLAKYKQTIQSATREQLLSIIGQIEGKIREIRAMYKIQAPSSVLLDILQMMENAPPGKATLMPLYVWRSLFQEDTYPITGMDMWPLHARIALDASGLVYAESRYPEVHLLEAIMFEDMAALFNLAKQEYGAASAAEQSKRYVKKRNTLCRAAIMATIYFVESYLNGLARDYVISNEPDLDLSARSVLEDWDYKQNRHRYLTLRDKLLQYQRILLKVEHAPLQETNCPEMATIIQTAKLVRDAVAHPSAAINPKTTDPEKERAILGLDFEVTQITVDAAVSLVLQIEETIRGDRKRLFWLHGRDSSGFFPDTTFQ